MITILDLSLEEYLKEFNLSVNDLGFILKNTNHYATILIVSGDYDFEKYYSKENYIAFKNIKSNNDIEYHIIDLSNVEELTKLINLKAFV